MTRFETSEQLRQVTDFEHPTLIDVFAFEDIFDTGGYPYFANSPSAYLPGGPQMKLGHFPLDDISQRKEHGAIMNFGERDNAMRNFNKAMDLLGALRSGFEVAGNASSTELFSMSDALKVSHMGIELPRYLLWKQFPQFQNGELPPETILLNRALRGFHGLLRGVHLSIPPEHRLEFMQLPYDAKSIAQLILDQNSLEANLSCVASWSMVEKMLTVMGGERVPSKPTTLEYGFSVLDLLNFSRSMRSVWDSIFPGLEHALNMAESGTARKEDVQQQLGRVVIFTNLATSALGNAIGDERVAPTDIHQLAEGLITYGNKTAEKEQELKTTIAKFLEQSL